MFFFKIFFCLILMFFFCFHKIFWEPVFFFKSFFFLLFSNKEFMFLSLIFFIVFFIFFFSIYYMSMEKSFSFFFFLLFLFVASMLILILSKNIFFLFVGWEGLGFSSFFLICFYKNWESFNNSAMTFFTNRLGDVMFLSMACYFLSSKFYEMETKFLIFFVFIVFTKSATYPFSSWLPAAMAAPTPISALVHSSTLVTAGLMLMKTLSTKTEMKLEMIIVFYFSLISMFYSSFLAIKEKDFKKIVALSTLSQISFMLFLFSMSLKFLSFFHLFVHAFFKSMLFFSVGSVLHSNFSLQDKRYYSNSFLFLNFSWLSLIVSLMSMCGLMFLSGFFSKDLILEHVLSTNSFFIVFIVFLTVSLTFFYSLSMVKVSLKQQKKFFKVLESKEQLTITLIFSLLVSFFFGGVYVNNLMCLKENFLTEEGFFSLLFLFFISMSFFFEVTKKMFENFFKLDFFSSKFSEFGVFKKFFTQERFMLEFMILMTFSSFKTYFFYFLKSETILLVFIFLSFLFYL